LLPSAVGPTLTWLADSMQGGEFDVVGRAGVGVLLVRIGGDVERQTRMLAGLRERLPAPTGSVVLVRGSDDLKSRVDPWGPLGDGLGVMRAIKRQFDPLKILNPGRGPGGL
jgi:glycolate oxidase FAD binding subunit